VLETTSKNIARQPRPSSPMPRQVSKQRCKSWSSGWRGSRERKPTAARRRRARWLSAADAGARLPVRVDDAVW